MTLAASAPSWAAAGAKVVCVDSRYSEPGLWWGDETLPQTGCVYTVREVKAHVSGELGILVEEIRNTPRPYEDDFREAFWALRRFRPVSILTIERDMEQFLPLLNTVGEDA